MVMTRPDWDPYFLGIAQAAAARADCRRRQVGAVLVSSDHRILSTGYNGAPAGDPGCLSGACPRGLQSLEDVPGITSSYDGGAGACISLHAEQNCLLYSSFSARVGGTLYITCVPCPGCLRMISGSGVARAVWPDGGWTPNE